MEWDLHEKQHSSIHCYKIIATSMQLSRYNNRIATCMYKYTLYHCLQLNFQLNFNVIHMQLYITLLPAHACYKIFYLCL